MGRAADVRPLTLVELPVAAVGDAVENLDREQRLRKILQEQVIAVEFKSAEAVEKAGINIAPRVALARHLGVSQARET